MEATKSAIKVAALCGSLRKASYNGGLVRSAMEICKESIPGMQIEYVEVSPLPMINTDLEEEGGKFPAVVEEFRRKISRADSFLFASPEYNYSIAPPLKNAIDWASRPPNVWADKAAAIVSAGGNFGGGRAQYHLRQTGVYVDLHFINKPELFVYAFQPPAKFDADGNLIDAEVKERLKQVLLSLQKFTLQLRGQCCRSRRPNDVLHCLGKRTGKTLDWTWSKSTKTKVC
ncbi:NAD(P)H:quinone oxidoreductase-like isoform X1 [Rhodamnia argentea]|uniref:NAD(P)H dehydrogenase (quinone) n=2 Tax=Rhodamnia argentea TaxID=178133 RepID=A0ABM3HFA5_9MYRT|nr:NAD(P)H:quinone oxidoreductase-like isoform X1 [Rhodamnia argentea]XP_048135254.1 NAD(P)H:quinone oxidoreductase-like isoform X1 [Rhodamnia argentea]